VSNTAGVSARQARPAGNKLKVTIQTLTASHSWISSSGTASHAKRAWDGFRNVICRYVSLAEMHSANSGKVAQFGLRAAETSEQPAVTSSCEGYGRNQEALYLAGT
jgi:hypothetical protein